jgi:two-component system nitrogen regulation sensor histidine kinase NtrY
MSFFKNNKYLLISICLLLLITLLIEVTSNYFVKKSTKNWTSTSKSLLEEIEVKTANAITKKHEELDNYLNLMISALSSNQDSNLIVQYDHNILNSDEFNNYQYYVFDKDSNLVLWSENANLSINYNSKEIYKENEYFFYRSNLIVAFCKFALINDYLIFVAQPIEKEYKLTNTYNKEISLSKELTRQFETEVKFDFVSTKETNKDGRFYSFPLYNNYNNTIAYVTVLKPRVSFYEINVKTDFTTVQSYLLIAVLLLLGVVLRRNRDLMMFRSIKFLIFAVYITLFRLVIFWFSLPVKFIDPSLLNPEYFESRFAFGLFQSPIDFLISATCVLVVLIQGSKYFLQYLQSDEESKFNNRLSYSILLFISIVFVLMLRGFGASMRSIVFESSLRYFKYPFVFPDVPTLIMDINILLLGVCSLVFMIYLIIMIFRLLNQVKISELMIIVIVFTGIQLMALLFDLVQLQPQGNAFLRISFITIIFICAIYLIKIRSINTSFIVTILFSASVITISYLIYYNSDYEIKSLRSTAFELLKPSSESTGQIIQDVVSNNSTIERLKEELQTQEKNNFDALAFMIWSKSPLENEKISSLVNIIDENKNLIGTFSYYFEEDFIWDWTPISDSLLAQTNLNSQLDNSGNRIIRSINPIFKDRKLLGYLEVSALLDYYTFNFSDDFVIIGSDKVLEKSPINVNQIKIFDFQDSVLTNYYTDLILSESESKQILNTSLNEQNEAWVTIPLNDVDHIIYVKKVRDLNKERFIAVALSENELSWSLFNFFKVFLIHCLFILVGLIIYFFLNLSKISRFTFTFRTQLLIAFIVISTIPLLLLGLHFKNLTEEKNTAAIYYKLGKRADRIEEYINDYTAYNESISDDILLKASNDTGIKFDIYDGIELKYSSVFEYYSIGLFPKIIRSSVYKNLLQTGRTDYVVKEKIENREYHSFYHKANIAGKDYLIGVNELFNRIQLPMSEAEVDTFLLGSYSLAIILVVVFSTILANQISSPIRKLTSATNAVAEGDLNISISANIKGEVGELVEGFNQMVGELRKNQKELAEMEREAAWKEMAKQVAHEIKNPLTPMKLAIQQLVIAKEDNSGKYEEIFKKVTDTVIKQIDILKNIATEFSNFAKMPDLKIEEINLLDLLEDVISLFEKDKFKIEIDTNLKSAIINSDSEQLQRSLVNLVRNSLQAGSNKIIFNLIKDNNNFHLRVIDNGHGISTEILSRIFDANFTTKVEGMGLGLNMVKRFFDSTNSSIEIESTGDNGTVILIKFNYADK